MSFKKQTLSKISSHVTDIAGVERLLSRVVRNVSLDVKYGGYLGALSGEVLSRHRHLGALNITNSDSAVLPVLFRAVSISEDDVLIDVGCGKGRVINWWLDQGFRNRLVGVEIDEEFARRTRLRLAKFTNVQIITGNILENFPADGSLFYMFHPFSESVLKKFKTLVFERCRGNVRIIYFNGVYIRTFQDDPSWQVQPIELPPDLFFSPADAYLIQRSTPPAI